MFAVKRQIGYVKPEIPDTKRITVAVLDSGVEARHPDLQGRILCFKDFINRKYLPYDDNGHGTHVCGIIGGMGCLSDERLSGICPNVQFIVLKVLNRKGEGESRILYEACRWILENYKAYHIRVLNISIDGLENEKVEHQERIKDLLDELWRRGICVICAAGNEPSARDTISYLGKGDKRICVGNYEGIRNMGDKKNVKASWFWNPIDKPDMFAPGNHILSCNSHYGYGEKKRAYTSKSGTSMATAVITGTIANMMLLREDLSINEMKELLIDTADPFQIKKSGQYGRVLNYKKLLTQMV